MEKDKYKELLNKNITKDYKRTENETIKDVTKGDKKEAVKL
jgi:hypothetical protein